MAKNPEREAAATAAATAKAAAAQQSLEQATLRTAMAQARLSSQARAAAQVQEAAAQRISAMQAASAQRSAMAQAKANLAGMKGINDILVSKAKADAASELAAAKAQAARAKAGADQAKAESLQIKSVQARQKAEAKAANDAKAAQTAASGMTDKLIGKKAAIKDVLGADFGNIASAASAAGGPIGALSDKLQMVASIVGKSGPVVAGAFLLVAAIVAVSAAAIVAAVALTRYALAAADAARSQKLFNNAAAGSAKGGAELSMVITDIASRSPLAKERIAEMGRELELAGLKGRRMQVALEMITMIEAAVPGAGAKIQALAEQFQKVKRAVLTKQDLMGTGLAIEDVAAQLAKTLKVSIATAKAMLQNGTASVDKVMDAMQKAIDAKFGKTVAAQMLALSVQFDKMKEDISGLFADVDLEAFLAGLKSITGMFSQQSAIGKALRPLLSGIFTGVFNTLAKAAPLIKGFLMGIAIVAIQIYIAFVKMKNAIVGALGGAGIDKAKALQYALLAGKAAAIVFTIAVVVLTAALLALLAVATILATGLAIMFLPIIIALALVSYAFYSLYDVIAGIDLGGAGSNMISSFIGALDVGVVVAAFTALGGAAKQALYGALGIASPSKIAVAAGENVTTSFADTVEEGTADTQKSFSKMVDPKSVKGAAKAEKSAGRVIYIEHHGSDESLAATVRICMRDNFEVEMLGAET